MQKKKKLTTIKDIEKKSVARTPEVFLKYNRKIHDKPR